MSRGRPASRRRSECRGGLSADLAAHGHPVGACGELEGLRLRLRAQRQGLAALFEADVESRDATARSIDVQRQRRSLSHHLGGGAKRDRRSCRATGEEPDQSEGDQQRHHQREQRTHILTMIADRWYAAGQRPAVRRAVLHKVGPHAQASDSNESRWHPAVRPRRKCWNAAMRQCRERLSESPWSVAPAPWTTCPTAVDSSAAGP